MEEVQGQPAEAIPAPHAKATPAPYDAEASPAPREKASEATETPNMAPPTVEALGDQVAAFAIMTALARTTKEDPTPPALARAAKEDPAPPANVLAKDDPTSPADQPTGVMPRWKPDPTGGGFIRVRAALVAEAEASEEGDGVPYGWKMEPSGEGLVKIPEADLPAPKRKGCWGKLYKLAKDTSHNGHIVEITSTQPNADGHLTILSEGEEFLVGVANVVPIEGSEQVLACHKGVKLASWRGPLSAEVLKAQPGTFDAHGVAHRGLCCLSSVA